MDESLLLIGHFVSCLFMVGVIWFVQLVHYPLMADVPGDYAVRYAHRHQQRTTWVVAPPMLIEVASLAGLLAWYPTLLLDPRFAIAVGLLLAIWVSTAALQVPLHGRLSQGYEAAAIRRLVASNWIRTVAWSTRAVLLAPTVF